VLVAAGIDEDGPSLSSKASTNSLKKAVLPARASAIKLSVNSRVRLYDL